MPSRNQQEAGGKPIAFFLIYSSAQKKSKKLRCVEVICNWMVSVGEKLGFSLSLSLYVYTSPLRKTYRLMIGKAARESRE
jgi:hypothetical protein